MLITSISKILSLLDSAYNLLHNERYSPHIKHVATPLSPCKTYCFKNRIIQKYGTENIV